VVTKKIKWIGIDYGQCLMSPSSLRNPLMFGDIGKLVGQHESIPVWINRMRCLKEKYGSISKIKEGHKDEIRSYVLDGDEAAMKIFEEKEQELLAMGPGAREFLEWTDQIGMKPSIVSELKKTLGPVGSDMITLFLERKGIIGYLDSFITPQGKMKLASGAICATSERYRGTSKEDAEGGTLYDVLIIDLAADGIGAEECVMIGDKWSTDIVPAKKRGFTTIQYTGHIDLGVSEYADYYAKDFYEVKSIVEELV
jgi:hypothetical protein